MSACSSRAGRRALVLVTAASLLTAGSAATSTAATAAPDDRAPGADVSRLKQAAAGDKLGQSDRAKLAQAVAAGTPRTTVMVVATRGQVSRAQNEVRRLGGVLRYAADELGYFSALVPTGKVEQAVALSSVAALDLDEVVPLPEPEVSATAAGAAGGPGASTPDDNPYMPTRETGSVAFKQQHPTWDGRGTTIGILDTGVDLAHPALRTTSTGERKVVDTFTATSPYEGDGTWRAMLTEVTVAGGTFRDVDGTTRTEETFTAPAGTYRFNRFRESSTNVAGGEVLGDVNRDGDRSDVWGVLYDPATNDVLVDVDMDKDFTDEAVRRPYGEAGQVGTFGQDDPRTGVVEAMPFTVDVREDVDMRPFGLTGTADWVDIGIVSGAHGSHVAGITAANDMFGGAMDGQAPGARLVSARACSFGPGCTAAALTDGMAELAANRGVDVINMSIGGLPALNDGNNARAALYNAIIAKGVQLVISAGNSGNALNTVGDPSVATDVISVGASISKATWKANYGSDVAFDHGMLTFSSGGPREDGGFKPDVTAPGSAVSTTPTWQPGGPVAEAGYALPAGYSMFNGTSMASPQAAGAIALMLSGAEAEGLAATSPAALRAAVYSTADHDRSVPAFLQGHGQLDVVEAYALLRQGVTPARFTVRAPVCTEVWNIVGGGDGTGLYNRCAAGAGGHAVGEAKSYPVTITRTSGSRAPGTYAVSLVGNDGTFRVQPSVVALPLGKAVQVRVTAEPAAGAHSALLRLDDRSTPAVDASVMLAVAAGRPLAAPRFDAGFTGRSERNVAQRYYVTVPTGAKALQVELGGLAAGTQTRFLAFHPYGLPVDSTSSLACYSNRGTDAACSSAKRAYADPAPGVWEIMVESRRTSPVASTPFTLKASTVGVTVDPAAQDLASVARGAAHALSWSVRNDFGAVTGGGVGGSLGSALSDRSSVAHEATLVRTVEVPAGAERLDVSIGNPTDTGADLDLYVTGPGGARSSADGDSEEAVSYSRPAAGTYTVEVEGYDVPAGTTAFDYRDAFTSPTFGSIDVTTGPTTLATGATTTLTGTLTAGSAVAPGRSLFGSMRFLSDSGAVLGTGRVTVGAVTVP